MEQAIKSEIMTTYDQLIEEGKRQGIQEGILKGIEKGVEKGIEKTKIESILKGYAAGADISFLAQIFDYSSEEVITILKEHGKLL